MKKKFTVSIFLLLYFFSFNQKSSAEWFQLPINSNAYLTAIYFIDSNIGFIGGITGYLAKTTDGGLNWNLQDPGFASPFVRDISFVNAETGYLCGDAGHIKKTTNGGASWFSLTTNTTSGIYGIDAVDEFNVYASVVNGTILRSSNAGADFQTVPVSSNQLLTIDFSSRDTGYTAGQGGVVYKTIDAGQSWTSLNASTLNNFWDICALNNNSLYLAAYYGTLRNSNDAGQNFKSSFGNNYLFEDISMENSMIGYTCALYGFINKTTNGGATWKAQTSGTSESLNEIFFLNATTGFVVGTNGTLLKTTDGGDDFKIALLSPNNREVLTTGASFKIQWSCVFSGNVKLEYSVNNGSSWNVIANSVPAESFEYNWTIPSAYSSFCKVRITSVENPTLADESDGIFSILTSNPFYNVPELTYYKFNNGSNTTPNYAVPGEITGVADISGMTLQNGGLADSALVGQGGNGISNNVFTNWATYLPPGGWTIGFWVNNVSLGTDPTNAVFLFTDITANNLRCYYGGALGLTEIDTAIMFRCNGMSNIRIPVVQGQTYYIHLVYEKFPAAVKVYVNGELTQNVPQDPLLIIGNGPFTIGAYADAQSSLAQNMRVDEFRVYNRSLDQSEISATWNTTFNKIITNVNIQNSSNPGSFKLYDNYPNPFNPVTNLEFGISEVGFVSLKVFDVAGKEVAVIVNEVLTPGKYKYQFSTVNYQLSSGVYFYELRSGEFVETKRMVLLK